MEGFQVGNKLVAMPGLSQEDIAKIEEQKGERRRHATRGY